MKSKYIISAAIAFGVVIGYNAFLIKRDAELFKAYDKQVAIENLKKSPSNLITPKEAYCKQQAGWHPDCNVE